MIKAHKDKNHLIVRNALRDWCGGMEHDKALGHYYAWLHGIPVAAYDMHGRGDGFPDWAVWVGWLGVLFEVKDERPVSDNKPSGQFRGNQWTRRKHAKMEDKEFYFRRLENSERSFGAGHPGLLAIVSTQDQVCFWLNAMVDFLQYVEHKSGQGRQFIGLFFPKATDPAATNLTEPEPEADPHPFFVKVPGSENAR